MDKTCGQVIAEQKAGCELPYEVIFWGGAFVRKCAATYWADYDAAEDHAHNVLRDLKGFRNEHPAIIRGPDLPASGRTIP